MHGEGRGGLREEGRGQGGEAGGRGEGATNSPFCDQVNFDLGLIMTSGPMANPNSAPSLPH